MSKKYTKWCPNGHGKKVIFLGIPSKGDNLLKGYSCLKCKERFTKEDLDIYLKKLEDEN